MRGLFPFLLTLFFATNLSAQVFDPVDWTYSQKQIDDKTVDVQFTATIDEGWHIYSSNSPVDASYFGTVVEFKKSDAYELVGKIKEPNPIDDYDEILKEKYSYHENKVTFTQRIKVLSTADFKVEGELVYMACDESGCLPPEYIDVSWKVKGAPEAAEVLAAAEAATTKNIASEVEPERLEIDYADAEEAEKKDTTNMAEESFDTSGDDGEDRSLVTLFILSFLGGFAALLTPCVFPMIPLTVSFFTKQSKTRAAGISKGITYGLSIVVLYTGLGYLITVVFGSDALNAFSTNPYVNLFFFVLLVVFAISFFGAFEITLPSKWVNKTDQAADKGGFLGIFFMAMTLALVSFSCTGPIIGGLLAEAASGGIRGPLVGMFGFSLALALPFTLFAAFPGWLNTLPKSGGWLNSVKVVLGFIELAFAFKFLSTADLVWQANILPREVFLAIWIGIFALITLYLLGGFRMPHDSPMDRVSVFRTVLAVVTLSFTIYLIPGMWGAPLKLISGFPPPMFYSESPNGVGATNMISTGVGTSTEIPEGADPEHCPHNLNCFHDFETGLAYAKKVGKPVMLDFTGWGCVNCRKMEEQVWSDPRVLEKLSEDVVLISLYVDERERLPQEEQYTSEVTGKKIKTIGNKWSEFQVKHYQSNSQPQYIIINHESMKPLIETAAYDPDIDKFIDWMERGVTAFEAQ